MTKQNRLIFFIMIFLLLTLTVFLKLVNVMELI